MFILGRYCVKCCTLGVTLELTTALTGQAVSPMSTSPRAISWREQCGLRVVLYILTRTDHNTDWSGRKSDVYVVYSDIMERAVRSSRSSVYFTRTDHSTDWSGRKSDVYVVYSDIMERAVRSSRSSVYFDENRPQH